MAVTAVDLVARFGFSLDLDRVLWVEAVLFASAGVLLLGWFRKGPHLSAPKRLVQALVIWGFFLGALRSAIWASGIPVQRANLAVLVVAVLAWAGLRFSRVRRK